MARKKTNTYENQAKLSIILAVLGALGTLAALVLLARNFTDLQTFWVMYNPRGKWFPLLGASLFFGVVAAGIGLLVAFNSAGQRRNELSRLAWIGFFVNAAIVTAAMCAGIFFVFTRHPIEPTG